MKRSVYIYFIGTAGSGKSSLTYAFGEWLKREQADIMRINLDPGAETLPYMPDVDIREWINLYDVMEEFNLGPNGAQIACADRIALKAPDVKTRIEEMEADYILVDTPGQIELFAFRNSSGVIIDEFDKDASMMVFLQDPFLSLTPSGYISQQLLYITCQLRFPTPFMNVLSKSDMMDEEKVDKIISWSTYPDSLYNAALDEAFTVGSQFNIELLRSIIDMDISNVLHRCSSETGYGMADIYNIIQQCFAGGEDIND